MKENVENIKFGMAFVVYSALTWSWFELNNSDSLPLIGHTELGCVHTIELRKINE